MQRVGGGGGWWLVVTNEMVYRAIFLVWLEYNRAGAWFGGYAHYYPPWNGTLCGLFNGPPVKSLILTSSTQL